MNPRIENENKCKASKTVTAPCARFSDLRKEHRKRLGVAHNHLLSSVLLLLVGSVGSLAELVLLGEFPRQDTQVLDQGLGGVNNSLAGGDFTVSLDTELELRGQRVRNLIDPY